MVPDLRRDGGEISLIVLSPIILQEKVKMREQLTEAKEHSQAFVRTIINYFFGTLLLTATCYLLYT